MADLLVSSRRLIEETLYRVKKMEPEMSALEERGRTLAEALSAPASPNGTGTPPPGAELVTELEREAEAVGARGMESDG